MKSMWYVFLSSEYSTVLIAMAESCCYSTLPLYDSMTVSTVPASCVSKGKLEYVNVNNCLVTALNELQNVRIC